MSIKYINVSHLKTYLVYTFIDLLWTCSDMAKYLGYIERVGTSGAGEHRSYSTSGLQAATSSTCKHV